VITASPVTFSPSFFFCCFFQYFAGLRADFGGAQSLAANCRFCVFTLRATDDLVRDALLGLVADPEAAAMNLLTPRINGGFRVGSRPGTRANLTDEDLALFVQREPTVVRRAPLRFSSTRGPFAFHDCDDAVLSFRRSIPMILPWGFSEVGGTPKGPRRVKVDSRCRWNGELRRFRRFRAPRAARNLSNRGRASTREAAGRHVTVVAPRRGDSWGRLNFCAT